MIKVIKAEWIADKALDMYCATQMDKVQTDKPIYRTTAVKSQISKIIEDVLKTVEDTYLSYDTIIITVPCFPIMRFKDSPSIITRLICKHPMFLKKYGISSVQFLDYFEKFIQKHCDYDGISKHGNIIFLKSKYILQKEWEEALNNKFGSTLLNFEKDYIFTTNPNFISSIESDDSLYQPITDEQKYKINTVLDEIL